VLYAHINYVRRLHLVHYHMKILLVQIVYTANIHAYILAAVTVSPARLSYRYHTV